MRWPTYRLLPLRVIIGILLIGTAVGYWQIALTNSRLTTSYKIQATLAPMWAYALAWSIIALALILTGWRRHTLAGRLVAAAAMTLLGTVATTWILASAWTGFYQYAILFLLLAYDLVALERET